MNFLSEFVIFKLQIVNFSHHAEINSFLWRLIPFLLGLLNFSAALYLKQIEKKKDSYIHS